MIYVPDDLAYDSCYYLIDNYTLRVYESVPAQDTTSNYLDIALDNHYIYREGVESFDSNFVPSCLSSSRITHAWSYRTDFFDILGCIGIISLFCAYLISRPLKWLFRGSV